MKGYVIRRNERVSAGIRRILGTQMDFAILQLAEAERQPDKAVHEVRKCFKRIRALLRLVRDETGYLQYRNNNIYFRDLGRKISGARDMAVHRKTLEALLKNPQVRLPASDKREIRGHLVKRHQEAREELFARQGLFREISSSLELNRHLPGELYLVNNDFSVISGGVRRVYGRGRKMMFYSRKFPTIENLHLLRKRMKYFWHISQIIHSIWPNMFDSLTVHLKNTSENLGLEHDLAIFGKYLTENFEAEKVVPLSRVIARERIRLHRQIFKNSYMIYAEKPADFVKRIEHYWNTSRGFSNRTF